MRDFEYRKFDKPRTEEAVRELLIAIGKNPNREGLQDNPANHLRIY